MNKIVLLLALILLPVPYLRAEEPAAAAVSPRQTIAFNDGWFFHRGAADGAMLPDFNDSGWVSVVLPHFPQVTPLRQPWKPANEGINWYRCRFRLPADAWGRKITLTFEGADQIAAAWINGVHLQSHMGSYLPFKVDLTDHLSFDAENIIALRVTNFADRDIPVYGSWISYGGLYRNAYLTITCRLHITDAIAAGKPAGGGIFITYPQVTDAMAQIDIKTEVANEFSEEKQCRLRTSLLDAAGTPVASSESVQAIEPGASAVFEQMLAVARPRLWHPNHPHLYTLQSEIFDDVHLADACDTRIGIRRIKFSHEKGFEINGERLIFMGTNRVQDYPYVAWAFPKAAQRWDVIRLKEAGFQYIRSSHNPQDPAFLDACDELGMLVMDCIPGFQFIGNDRFRDHSCQNMREVIRRDRNHPCVILWELSLNETDYDSTFARTAFRIGHEEFPGNQCFIAGWKFPGIYDVFLQASQHGARQYDRQTPLVISEYGHWEFGGGRSSSDAERRQGETAMLAQVKNHMESLSLNRALPFLCGDGLWVGIDFQCYPSGVLDYFRLPKFSCYFYQSQRDPELVSKDCASGPMVFIANYWTAKSPLPVTVFSNCERVDLFLNGKKVASQAPDTIATFRNLLHPPFTFQVPFNAGELKAVGYHRGSESASHIRWTPGTPCQLLLDSDLKSAPLANGQDLFFVHAALADERGSVVCDSVRTVAFRVEGAGMLVSPAQITTEGGIASALVRSSGPAGPIIVTAETPGIKPGRYANESH